MKSEAVTPGDLVSVELSKEVYEGILLETPADQKGIILLKLASGYNIGFDKKSVVSVSLLKKATNSKALVLPKQDSSKPAIGMIVTGGTIAARLNPKKGGVDWLDTPDQLFYYYPDLFSKVSVKKLAIPFMKASEDMDYKDWQLIAKTAEPLLNDPQIKGLIITHGTDFLHYTSAALSFFLRDLNKPVVLTYSQRSIDRASCDANLNLQCAAEATLSDIAEVMLVGHETTNDTTCLAMPGTKVKKMHSSRRDAFKVVNAEPFARIYPNRVEKLSNYHARDLHKKVVIDTSFEPNVALIKVHPGQDPKILEYYLAEGYKGVVLELSGLGHAPTMRARSGWTATLKKVQQKGLIVCATSQTIFGRVDSYVYSNGRELLATGIIYLADMLSETALVKLGWVLGHKTWAKDRALVASQMQRNIAGELRDRLLQ